MFSSIGFNQEGRNKNCTERCQILGVSKLEIFSANFLLQLFIISFQILVFALYLKISFSYTSHVILKVSLQVALVCVFAVLLGEYYVRNISNV